MASRFVSSSNGVDAGMLLWKDRRENVEAEVVDGEERSSARTRGKSEWGLLKKKII